MMNWLMGNWELLAFCLGFVGLVLCVLWINERSENATIEALLNDLEEHE